MIIDFEMSASISLEYSRVCKMKTAILQFIAFGILKPKFVLKTAVKYT